MKKRPKFYSAEREPIIERMLRLVKSWEAAADRRAIFLNCYKLMTYNMLAALEAGEFNDPVWVHSLLRHFAGYYFAALDLYDQYSPFTPEVWRITHDAARDPDTLILQNLLLGVNAHINYDLVLTLVDILAPEWDSLSLAQRTRRYSDHYQVNTVIGRTIDAVQEQVIEPRNPRIDALDKLLGPLDEWMTSRLISHWRDEVWQAARAMLESQEPAHREARQRTIETVTLRRARAILLRESFPAFRHLV